jgi:hypothetical protein
LSPETAFILNQTLATAFVAWGKKQRELLWWSGMVEDSGVRIQVSGKRNMVAETCWSEAEIPSEAKLQRGTLLAAPKPLRRRREH